MSRTEIRAAVDAAIRRHLEARAALPAPASPSPPRPAAAPEHPSHDRYPVADGIASGGRCVIEPGVACTRSGHCQTQGY